jgi:hypothetical protein
MAYSRRQFLSNTPVAVAGSLLLSQSVLANTKPVRKISSSSLSGLSTGETLPLTHTEIPSFLSAEQLQVHHDKHYAGALKGYLKLDAELIGEKFDSTAMQADCEQDLKKQIVPCCMSYIFLAWHLRVRHPMNNY